MLEYLWGAQFDSLQKKKNDALFRERNKGRLYEKEHGVTPNPASNAGLALVRFFGRHSRYVRRLVLSVRLVRIGWKYARETYTETVARW